MSQKFIIIPFQDKKGRPVPLEMRQSSTEEGAVRLAKSMSTRHTGVVALAVMVDKETGDMTEPRQLARYGNVPELELT